MEKEQWLDFFRRQLPSGKGELILPIDRITQLDFEWKPANHEEFEQTIQMAPISILEGFGFVRYSNLTEVYKDSEHIVQAKVGIGNELMLFPLEWYGVIPKGFCALNIYGQKVYFQPGITDADARLGCLSYGIAIVN